MRSETLLLEQIRIDGGTQVRKHLDEAAVEEYAARLEHESPPPAVVFFDGSDYWMADGFHRYFAFRKARRARLACEVHEGTRRDALLHALGANADHGVPRTIEDREHAVRTMLSDQEWQGWADRAIAKKCRVSPALVARLKKETAGASACASRCATDNVPTESGKSGSAPAPEPVPEPATEEAPKPRVVERNGTQYTMDTAKIGNGKKQRKKREPKEEPTPEVVRDGLGNPVPSLLADAFADTTLREAQATVQGWFDAMVIDSLISTVTSKLRAFPFVHGEKFATCLKRAKVELEQAVEALDAGRPFTACPRCDGSGCEKCRNCGHVPDWRYTELKEQEQQEAVA